MKKKLWTLRFHKNNENGFYRVKAYTLDDAITKTKLQFGLDIKFYVASYEVIQ